MDLCWHLDVGSFYVWRWEELLRVGLVRIKVNVSWGLVTSWRQFGPYLTFKKRIEKTVALGT